MTTLTPLQIKIIQKLVDLKGGAEAAGDFYRVMSPSDLAAAIKVWVINRAAEIDNEVVANVQKNTTLLAEKQTYDSLLKG